MMAKMILLVFLFILIVSATSTYTEEQCVEDVEQFFSGLGYKSKEDFMVAGKNEEQEFFGNALSWNDEEFKAKCNDLVGKWFPVIRQVFERLLECLKIQDADEDEILHSKDQLDNLGRAEDTSRSVCNSLKGNSRQGE
jgi:hypothetical protein